jgi:hypothetical protein
MLYNSGSMWPSVVVHEHWPVSQRMIVEMGDYAWSEHIVAFIFGLSDYHQERTSPWRRVHWSDESRFFVTPYRRSCKGLAPTKHFISGQPHFGHNCFWGWGVTVWGCFMQLSEQPVVVKHVVQFGLYVA